MLEVTLKVWGIMYSVPKTRSPMPNSHRQNRFCRVSVGGANWTVAVNVFRL